MSLRQLEEDSVDRAFSAMYAWSRDEKWDDICAAAALMQATSMMRAWNRMTMCDVM